ncbi:MAG: YdcF family protein [Gemmatimonadaceae bacterium]|nr:YdcF family protein [Gemmatimonadaceae bacterium]
MGSAAWTNRRIALMGARLLVVAWLVSLGGVLLWGTRDAARASDAIVVLGAAQYDGRPSPVLRARLDHALSLWKRGLAPRVILTGGKGAGDTTSEAAVGRVYMLRRGVPDTALLMENEGRSTAESLGGVARLAKRRGIEDIILVSDPFHMMRLQILAWRHGLHAVPSPTLTSPISANRMESVGYILSESLKVPLTALLALTPAMSN